MITEEIQDAIKSEIKDWEYLESDPRLRYFIGITDTEKEQWQLAPDTHAVFAFVSEYTGFEWFEFTEDEFNIILKADAATIDACSCYSDTEEPEEVENDCPCYHPQY